MEENLKKGDLRASTSIIGKEDAIIVGGEIRRVAIITIGYHPWACYLARTLRFSGVELFLFNQNAPHIIPNSWKYFWRLSIKRGLVISLDNLFLFIFKCFKAGLTFPIRYSSKVIKRYWGVCDEQRSRAFLLDSDLDIKKEDWLSIVEVNNINSQPDQDRLRTIEPDLILLAGAPILSRSSCEVAKIACLNAHEGISPMYAGSSPLVWPLYEKRFNDIGFTIHMVVPTVDGGPIIYQERINWEEWINRDEWNPKQLLNEIQLAIAQRKYARLADITLTMIKGKIVLAKRQVNVRVMPPAGYVVSKIAGFNWANYVKQLKKRSSKGMY